jgi:hypothetical protein
MARNSLSKKRNTTLGVNTAWKKRVLTRKRRYSVENRVVDPVQIRHPERNIGRRNERRCLPRAELCVLNARKSRKLRSERGRQVVRSLIGGIQRGRGMTGSILSPITRRYYDETCNGVCIGVGAGSGIF